MHVFSSRTHSLPLSTCIVAMSQCTIIASACSGGAPGEDPLLEQGSIKEQGDRLSAGGQACTERASVATEVSGEGRGRAKMGGWALLRMDDETEKVGRAGVRVEGLLERVGKV